MFINKTTKTVDMSKQEYDLAMTYGTKEYHAWREIHGDYPAYDTRIVSDSRAVKTKDTLTMQAIKAHVKANGTPEQKAEFEIIAFAHFTEEGDYIPAQPFFKIKRWFNAEFPDYIGARDQHNADVEAIFKATNEKIAAAKEKAAQAKKATLEAEAADFLRVS